MAGFDPAHVEPGGAPYRYPGGPPVVTKLSVGPFDNNAYLITDPEAGEALLIDAADEPARILSLLDGTRLVGVITTHRHPDHWQALAPVLAATGAWHGAHPADAPAIGVRADRLLEHGATCGVGRFSVTVLHTPGHTPGSISVKLPSDHVLTGDALFPGGVGRTATREDFEQAIASAERHLLALPEHTRVSPGHGDDTFVGRERPQLGGWKARGW